jgi:DNA-directed RNA polymerase specialized sigma24 family protein
MTNNQAVEHTYKRHHVWLSQCAFNFANDKLEAENLVQDLYLKMLELKDIKKIMYKDDINLYYLYKMLRSLFLNNQKKSNPTQAINDDMLEIHQEEYSYEIDSEFEEVVKLTNEALDKVHWFDSRLLKVYIEEKHSIQSLHDATGISNSTIWTSMKKTKQYVKEYVKQNKTR